MKRDLFYIESSRGTERVFYQPYGWDQAGWELQRNETYQGMFRSFVFSALGFIKDGKAIVKALKENEGTECQAFLIVKRFDPATHYYTQCYRGKINFATYNRLFDRVELNIEDSDFQSNVKNREEIPVILNKLIDMDGGVIIPFGNEKVQITLPMRGDYYSDFLSTAPIQGVNHYSHAVPLILDNAQTLDSHSVADYEELTGVAGSY